MPNIADFPSWLPQYIGIPYKENGRDRRGLDCYGLPVLIFQEQACINLEPYTNGFDLSRRESAMDGERASGTWLPVKPGNERILDIGIMETPVAAGGKWSVRPVHLGVIVAPGTILDIEKGKLSWAWSYRSKTRRYQVVEIWRHHQLA